MPLPLLPPPSVPALTIAAPPAGALPPLDNARVRVIAAMLPDAPGGPGHPITDRAFWDQFAADPACASIVGRATGLLETPLPPYPRDMYLDYSRNGNRTRYQDAEGRRRSRLGPLVLAECIENKGRFIPAIAEVINALCEEPTWVLPAHDGARMENFEGKTIDIELWSSALAANLGATDYLLGDKLPEAARTNLRANVRRRILTPFNDMIDGKRSPNWWIKGTNNWNAVCLSGVVGAALYEEPSKEGRARIVAAGERYVQNFLSGFTADGYCGEGLGYWNYGFGRFYLLAECTRQATGGGVDLMADPGARMPALFAARIAIMNGISPAFADCPVFAKPDRPLMYAVNHRFSLGLTAYSHLDKGATLGDLFQAMIYATGDSAPPVPKPAGAPSVAASGAPPRDFFDAAGILVCRPGPTGTAKLGVALKGGNNAESHNHNDLGSFVVVVENRPVLLDPGGEVYTARTFSSRRYDSKLLNSFGHAVPIIGGVLQHPGADAHARVLKADFTPDADAFTLDISSAYTVPDLKTLTRTWVYSRKGDGSLTMTDRVSLAHPQTYSTALITLGSVAKQKDGTLLVTDGDSAVTVKVDTGGAPWILRTEPIQEDAAVKPTRIGIELEKPVTDTSITLTITPVAENDEAAASGNLLRNGDFERGGRGWQLDGMSQLSVDRAATGSAALRIHDTDSTRGSGVTSSPSAIPAGTGKLTLTGKANFASGGGIGIYVRFFDAAGESLDLKDAAGNEHPVGTLAGGTSAKDKWEPFSFPVPVPAGAAKVQVWIHSYNGTLCDAYLDDLELR